MWLFTWKRDLSLIKNVHSLWVCVDVKWMWRCSQLLMSSVSVCLCRTEHSTRLDARYRYMFLCSSVIQLLSKSWLKSCNPADGSKQLRSSANTLLLSCKDFSLLIQSFIVTWHRSQVKYNLKTSICEKGFSFFEVFHFAILILATRVHPPHCAHPLVKKD